MKRKVLLFIKPGVALSKLQRNFMKKLHKNSNYFFMREFKKKVKKNERSGKKLYKQHYSIEIDVGYLVTKLRHLKDNIIFFIVNLYSLSFHNFRKNWPYVNKFLTNLGNVCLSVILEFFQSYVVCCMWLPAYIYLCRGLEYLLKIPYLILTWLDFLFSRHFVCLSDLCTYFGMSTCQIGLLVMEGYLILLCSFLGLFIYYKVFETL